LNKPVPKYRFSLQLAGLALLLLGGGGGGCDSSPDAEVPTTAAAQAGSPKSPGSPNTTPNLRADLVVLQHQRVPKGSFWQVEGTLQNRGDHEYDWVRVRIRLMDKRKKPVGETSCGLGSVSPGTTRSFTAMVLDTNATDYHLLGVEVDAPSL
jgi:hypothetical protein